MSRWHTTEFCETCAKEFCCTSECKYHLLHRIKKAREEIENLRLRKAEFITSDNKVCIDSKTVLEILDKLIAESEEKE
jgi:hypothetical protein